MKEMFNGKKVKYYKEKQNNLRKLIDIQSERTSINELQRKEWKNKS